MKAKKEKNEAYHAEKQHFNASRLKCYFNSYKAGLAYDNEIKEPTNAMQLGTAWHSLMEGQNLAIFEPPVNPSTGKAYGNTSQKFADALEVQKANNPNAIMVSEEDSNKLLQMKFNLLEDYRWVEKGEQINEQSIYDETGQALGFKAKIRPDRIIQGKNPVILDFKTTSLKELNPYTLNREIYKYNLDIQVALYVALADEYYNVHHDFIFIFTQTVEPFESLAIRALCIYERGLAKIHRAIKNSKEQLKLYENFENANGIVDLDFYTNNQNI